MERLPYPLFKGMTRVATFLGVPIVPLVLGVAAVAFVAMWSRNLLIFILVVPVWGVMWAVTSTDDKKFRLLGLWFETTFSNKHKAFWNASTYSRTAYRKRK